MSTQDQMPTTVAQDTSDESFPYGVARINDPTGPEPVDFDIMGRFATKHNAEFWLSQDRNRCIVDQGLSSEAGEIRFSAHGQTLQRVDGDKVLWTMYVVERIEKKKWGAEKMDGVVEESVSWDTWMAGKTTLLRLCVTTFH